MIFFSGRRNGSHERGDGQRGSNSLLVRPPIDSFAGRFGREMKCFGKPVTYARTPAGVSDGGTLAAMRELVGAMNSGSVDSLVCLGTNPVYDAPAELDFAAAYAKVRHRIHSGLWNDETARESTWHVPMTGSPKALSLRTP